MGWGKSPWGTQADPLSSDPIRGRAQLSGTGFCFALSRIVRKGCGKSPGPGNQRRPAPASAEGLGAWARVMSG